MKRRLIVHLSQAAIVAAFLAAWQWLPSVSFLSEHWSLLNPAIISSPERTAVQIWNIMSGADGTPTVWPYLGRTMEETALAVAFGLLLGELGGLIFSSVRAIDDIFQPFIYAVSAVPIVAIIPILDILLGPHLALPVTTGAIIVFFLTFYNAREGGITIAKETLDNCRLLGSAGIDLMIRVRLMYVTAWTFSNFPNAVSFGIIGVVTAEFLTGVPGLGYLLTLALSNSNATQTLAIAVILAVVSLLVIILSRSARRRILHWWG